MSSSASLDVSTNAATPATETDSLPLASFLYDTLQTLLDSDTNLSSALITLTAIALHGRRAGGAATADTACALLCYAVLCCPVWVGLVCAHYAYCVSAD